MHLEEVIRRNRRWIAVITSAAAVNHWTVITLTTWLLCVVALEVEPLPAFVTAAVVGVLFAGGTVLRQLT